MFASHGWKDLLDDMETYRKSVNELSTVADEQSLFFRKGQLDILDLIIQRKVMCEKAYEELQNEENV